MAERYVSALATSGDGSAGDPWTFAQFVTALNDSTIDNGDRVNIKADGTYVTPDVAITRAAAIGSRITIEGYTSTIGDGGRPTIQRQAGEVGSFLDWDVGYYQTIKNFVVDGNNVGDNTGALFRSHDSNLLYGIEFKDSNNEHSIDDGLIVNCYLNNVDHANSLLVYNSLMVAQAGQVGFSTGFVINSIVVGASRAFENPTTIVNCIAYQCGYGLYVSSGNRHAINCIFAECTTAGVYTGNATTSLFNCNFDDNASDKILGTGTIASLNEQTLASQFNDPGSLDFTRTGDNLNRLGLSEIGTLFDYEIPIGPHALVEDLPAVTDVLSGVDYDFDRLAGTLSQLADPIALEVSAESIAVALEVS